MTKRLTTEEFITKAKLKRPNEYDYKETIYTTAKEKVVITCPTHGNFLQTPDIHLRGSGCPLCGRKKRDDVHRVSVDVLITRFVQIHGDLYSYITYKNMSTKIKIFCKTHNKYFYQTPASHLRGNGCPACGTERGARKISSSTRYFISKSNEVHNNTYKYTLTDYVNNTIPVTITCKVHGNFEQTPAVHLCGRGCQLCGYEKNALSRTSNTKEFISKAVELNGDYYDYSLVEYVNNHTCVTIICKIHGEFTQPPSSHLSGSGCSSCNKHGFSGSDLAILYYLSINNGQGYKIGITNRSVGKRFSLSDLQKITIVKEWSFTKGAAARAEETRIKRKYKDFKYKGNHLLDSGNSEVFAIDILDLDT